MIRYPTFRTAAAAISLGIAVSLALWLQTKHSAGARRLEGLAAARQRMAPRLAAMDLHLGAPVFIRISKESRELEV